MSKPPPLPAQVLTRVLRLSGFDAYALIYIAGGFALISAIGRDGVGALVGGLAVGAGLIELHGRRRLRASDISGVNWLVRSQVLLLANILSYVAYQIYHYDPQPMLALIEESFATAQRMQGMAPASLPEMLGMTKPELLARAKATAHLAYMSIGVASVFFQGGLAYYYHRKGPVIARALSKS